MNVSSKRLSILLFVFLCSVATAPPTSYKAYMWEKPTYLGSDSHTIFCLMCVQREHFPLLQLGTIWKCYCTVNVSLAGWGNVHAFPRLSPAARAVHMEPRPNKGSGPKICFIHKTVQITLLCLGGFELKKKGQLPFLRNEKFFHPQGKSPCCVLSRSPLDKKMRTKKLTLYSGG